VTSVFSEPEMVTPALMLSTLAEPLPETVAVVSISVSSIDDGGAAAGVELPSVVVHDDVAPNGSSASAVFSQKSVRGFAGMAPLQKTWSKRSALTLLKSEFGAIFTVK
jgi:hypothetical protein